MVDVFTGNDYGAYLSAIAISAYTLRRGIFPLHKTHEVLFCSGTKSHSAFRRINSPHPDFVLTVVAIQQY